MVRCTLACEKGLSMGTGAEAAAGDGAATVSEVWPSMTELQSSPSTARIRSSLQASNGPSDQRLHKYCLITAAHRELSVS